MRANDPPRRRRCLVECFFDGLEGFRTVAHALREGPLAPVPLVCGGPGPTGTRDVPHSVGEATKDDDKQLYFAY